jgi:PIN domain nuclease of toxin-antitoxin system
LADSARIRKGKRTYLEDLSNTSYVSAASITELMFKASLGKPHVDFDPVDMAKQSGFAFLDFNADAAKLLKDMPFHNKDPFDRMSIAQDISHILFNQDC